MNKKIDMTTGKIHTVILKFAFPLMVGNILQQLYVFFDTLIVGKYVGLEGLAALGINEWIIFIIISGVQGITHGFSIDTAQAVGKKEKTDIQNSINNSFVLCTIIIIIVSILGVIFGRSIIKMLNTPAELVNLSWQYLRVLIVGLFITVYYNQVAAWLRAVGDSVTPLKALTIASFVNILLDILFVKYLKYGVVGAAVATLIAQLFSLLYCIAMIYKKKCIPIQGRNFKISFTKCSSLLKLGVPLGFQNIIIGIGGVFVQSQINTFGVTFIAAYTAANKLYGLLEIGASSLGSSMATFVGQNMGANQYQRIRKGMKVSVLLSVILGYAMSVIMLIFGKNILSCFLPSNVNSVEALTIGYQFLTVLAIFFPLLYFLYAMYATVQGIGKTFNSMLSSIAQLVMRIFCAFVVTRYIGYYGFFIGEVLAWVGSDTILLICYFSQINKNRVGYEHECG